MNMENGILKKDWPDDYIFVDEKEIFKEDKEEKLKESTA
jgi:hypothetical protein